MEERFAFAPADERMHPVDPADPLWNESWFFSWMPQDGSPAAFYRLGLLPNQKRGWLWFYLDHGGEWLCFEETRLDLDHFDVSEGARYDKWALRFGYLPVEPLRSGTFHIAGLARVQGGARQGALVPVEVDARVTALGPCFSTGPTTWSGAQEHYVNDRFEQSLAVEGELTIDGRKLPLNCTGHRDRSWGTRDWRIPFVNADLHGDGIQVYWAGSRQPGARRGKGYVRTATGMDDIVSVAGRYEYSPDLARLGPSDLTMRTESGEQLALHIRPVSDSIRWNMAHTGVPWDNWPYWRIRIAARIAGRQGELHGWLDASHYGVAPDDMGGAGV